MQAKWIYHRSDAAANDNTGNNILRLYMWRFRAYEQVVAAEGQLHASEQLLNEERYVLPRHCLV